MEPVHAHLIAAREQPAGGYKGLGRAHPAPAQSGEAGDGEAANRPHRRAVRQACGQSAPLPVGPARGGRDRRHTDDLHAAMVFPLRPAGRAD
eukprot:6160199-Prymnesium_polylepis.1